MANITVKNFKDESTTLLFKFIFYCDCCNKIVLNYLSKNPNSYKAKLFTTINQKEKEKMWIKGHDESLKTAKALALENLNRCEICGRIICDECSIESDKLNGKICCKKCNSKV